PDSRTVAGSRLDLMDAISGEIKRSSNSKWKLIGGTFSGDGRYFVGVHQESLDDYKIVRWSCDGWHIEQNTLMTSKHLILSPAFSPDNSTLAFAAVKPDKGWGFQLMEIESGKTKAWLRSQSSRLSLFSLVFSRDGKRL